MFCLSGVLFTATASTAFKFNVANVILCCFTAFIWLFFGLLIGCKVNGGTSLFWLNELVECCECILADRRAELMSTRMGDEGDAVMCGGNGPTKLYRYTALHSPIKKGIGYLYGWPLQSVFYYLFLKSIVKQILYMLERL